VRGYDYAANNCRGPKEVGLQIDFNSSPSSSVGIEMELEVVDRETRELRSGATEILGEMGADAPRGRAPEGQARAARVDDRDHHRGLPDGPRGRDDLASTLAEVTAMTAPRGMELMCSGTHPFSDWAKQDISPNPRYAQLVEDMQWLARRLQIFGIHVHVGVRSPDKVIPIVNALTTYVPHFLGLSASSPYWVGTDTGLASCRSKVFEGLPTAGLPYQLSGWNEFETYMETLICSNTIHTIREIWWDIRPHPNFGTVELRICDGLPTLREVATMAALSQCLVTRLDTLLDRGYTLPMPKGWILRENKWRAARYGVDAEIILDEKGTLQPVRDAVRELVTSSSRSPTTWAAPTSWSTRSR
jgi:carboxylate-amine ligase